MNRVVSKSQPLHHYIWSAACEGWNLVENENISIKIEMMPAGASEALHYHQHAQQFFFILKGSATFEIEEEKTELKAGEGIQIKAGEKHCIFNMANEALEFILCSQPATINDRFNCV